MRIKRKNKKGKNDGFVDGGRKCIRNGRERGVRLGNAGFVTSRPPPLVRLSGQSADYELER